MSYYTDFILKFPFQVVSLQRSPHNDEEQNCDLACLAVIKLLVPRLTLIPLEDTMCTDLPRVTQQQVHALMHGLPWSRPDEVQVIFREEAAGRYCDTPSDQISIRDAARGLLDFVGPEALNELRLIKEPTVGQWLRRYVLPGLTAETDTAPEVADASLHVFGGA
jgi:hypothetical protein